MKLLNRSEYLKCVRINRVYKFIYIILPYNFYLIPAIIPDWTVLIPLHNSTDSLILILTSQLNCFALWFIHKLTNTYINKKNSKKEINITKKTIVSNVT